MTIVDNEPATTQEQTAQPRTLHYTDQQSPTAGAGWVLGLVLGALAIGMIGLVAIVIGAMALSGGEQAPAVAATTLEISAREFGHHR